jgi:hypothetical protein
VNAEQTAGWARDFKLLIERCGAEFLGVEAGTILFRGGPNEPVCSLYPFACTEENIRLALKSELEKKRSAQWEFAEVAKPIS